MASIFLAGASGAIGRRLGPLLVVDGHRVIGTTRQPDKQDELAALGIEPIVLDVFDADAVRHAVLRARPGIVIHQLTDLPAGLKSDDMPAALARNARLREIGTAHLLAAARAAEVERVIAQSIAFAYAPGPKPHAEGDPIDSAAHGVLSLERQVLAGPFVGIVLRYGRLWGPGTGFDAPQDAPAPLHVDAAAEAARLAVAAGSAGPYNVAEEDGEVLTGRARSELGWNPDFRCR